VNPQFHDEFVALCALYYSGEISEEEWALLQIHMAYCEPCHDRFRQYQQVTSDLIPAMAGVAASESDTAPAERASLLDAAERRLMSRLDSTPTQEELPRKQKIQWQLPAALVAACLVGVASLIAFHGIGYKRSTDAQSSPQVPIRDAHPPVTPKIPETDAQQASPRDQTDVTRLQQQLVVAEDKLKQSNLAMAALKDQLQTELDAHKQLSGERDALNQQLTTARADADSLRNQSASAKSDDAQQAARVQALEARVRELNASLEDKEAALSAKDRMLALDQDFLAHDRDIRDLIGARNLYIADIFDTGESGKTSKQFGRIFYTKDRSLVFYGFDLDKQAGSKRDVSFQVWGSGSDKPVVSLGLFYQDDTNKRWILRCNDAKTLARLDMVFVTAEPPGGSTKPTGKQLLRAYLQIPPNHP
jgi:hypothetical protein